MATRKELVEALRGRYRAAAGGEKVKILDEFVALTGYHRKHAIRVLREEVPSKETRARNRLYDEAVRQALTVLWEAADRVCGKRLKALVPMLVDAMERHGHSTWTRSSRPRSCRLAQRPSIASLPMRVRISRGSAGAALALAQPSDAAFRCARSPIGGIRRHVPAFAAADCVQVAPIAVARRACEAGKG